MDDSGATEDWLEDDLEAEPEDDIPIDEYDLTSTPNDFNIKTIVDFLEPRRLQGSRLSEELRVGGSTCVQAHRIPAHGATRATAFLYEQGKNDFLVVDGQRARLLSILLLHPEALSSNLKSEVPFDEMLRRGGARIPGREILSER